MSTNYVGKGLLKLYWYMLCNNKEYREDYKKYAETNQGEADMCVKWELLHPFTYFVLVKATFHLAFNSDLTLRPHGGIL